MRPFFDIRIFAGLFLTVTAVTLLIFSHIQPGQEKLDRMFTRNVDRIHQNTRTQLKSAKHYDQLSLPLPVFIYNQYDSLIYWSEEIFPGPDSLLQRTDSVFKFSYKGIETIIFKDTSWQLKYFIVIPVKGHKFAKKVLPNRPFYNNIPDNIELTYKGLFKFKAKGFKDDEPFSPLSWGIVMLVLASVILIARGIRKRREILNPGIGKVLPYTLFTTVILMLDLFNLLPPDWFLAQDLIQDILWLSPYTLILLLVMGMIMTSHPYKLKINIVSGQLSTMSAVPLLYLFIGISAVLAVNFSRSLYLEANQNFNLDRLFSVGTQELTLLFILLILFTLCILVIQHTYKLIRRISHSRYIQMAGAAFTFLILFLFKLVGWIQVPFIPFLLGFVILIILLDLYYDRKGFSSNWVLTWMIVISSFLSFVIFDADLQKDLIQNKQSLTENLHERDHVLEKQLGTNHPTKITNYNQDKVILESQHLQQTMSGMAKINDSLYFDPLGGNYLVVLPFNGSHEFQSLLLLRRTDAVAKPEQKSNERLSIIYKSWTDGSDKAYPLKDSTWNKNGVSYISHSNLSGFTVVSARQIPGLLRPVSLFAALFFIISLSLFLISVLDAQLNILPSALKIRFFNQKSLRNRIQISILTLTILAFVVVGFVSVNYFKKIYAVQLEELSKANAKAIRLELQSDIDEISENAKGKNTLIEAFISPGFTAMSGHLQCVKPRYGSGSLMNHYPVTTPNLRIPHHFSSWHKVKTGILSPSSDDQTLNGVYIPLELNGTIKYFFDPAIPDDEMQGKISDLLATFLSIYAVLFMVSVAMAIGLANSITHPIEILGQKLKGLKLSRKNETVEWQNEDEIGTLISIYNEMINKLGDNAKLMAKIERDSAWKEMAQQVAHEIKNPLTPLKLNIQYLESKVGSNPEIAPQLIAQLAPSLIEQIDNLSQIASEFSNFAQLPDARNEKLNLNDLVKKVHDFFRKREDMNLKLTLPITDVIVFADKNHMVRILNNVIKNAIQAIPEDRPGRIAITLYRQDSNAVIKVSDNGTGIPEHMREKVFSPNFTTKSSGTGLGLAIAINMLESFGGRIYFETEENVGSDFFIEVPLMRLEDNFPQANAVFLED